MTPCPSERTPGQANAVHGLTLIELLLALAVVAVLGGIAVPSYTAYVDKANIAQAQADIRLIEQVIERYAVSSNGALPNGLGDIGMGSFLDPWGNPYRYLDIASVKGKGALRKDRFLVPINTDYDLYSMGKDGKSQSPLTAKASRDDIVRANNGAYIGLASGY